MVINILSFQGQKIKTWMTLIQYLRQTGEINLFKIICILLSLRVAPRVAGVLDIWRGSLRGVLLDTDAVLRIFLEKRTSSNIYIYLDLPYDFLPISIYVLYIYIYIYYLNIYLKKKKFISC